MNYKADYIGHVEVFISETRDYLSHDDVGIIYF